MRNLTIVVGCGRLGGAIANYSSAQGDSVIVVDPDPNCRSYLTEVFSGVVYNFDATDESSLIEAGIANAREVIITTGDDNINLFLAHLCPAVHEAPYVYAQVIYPFQLSKDRFSLLRAGLLERGERK